MKDMTLSNITEAVEGRLYPGEEAAAAEQTAASVAIDSRLCSEGSVFVAIKGERSDGHAYIRDVFSRGAMCVICGHLPEDHENGGYGPCIVVEDTRTALKKLAAWYRSRLDIRIVGIVGSMGKTSTKEMVAAVLSTHYNTHRTSGNFNNEIGVPLTLLAIREEHEIAVVEMGISDFGEMDRLGEIVRPDAVVMTNIGPCHLEFLHDLDGVLKAKSEVFRHIRSGGTVFLNAADVKLRGIGSVDGCGLMYYNSCGPIDGKKTVYVENVENNGLLGSSFDLFTPVGRIRASVPLPGAHTLINAQAGAAVGAAFGLTPEEMAQGIASVRPVRGRGFVEKTDEFLLIDDCYNANPESVKAALNLLDNAIGRKCAVLGDMFELGENGALLHEQTGREAAEHGLSIAVFIGELSANSYSGCVEALSGHKECTVRHYGTIEEFLADIAAIPFERGDNILFKASHGMHFDKILDFFRNNDILKTG